MAKATKGKTSKSKILIVDDDERNLLALSEVLNPIAQVVTASSGKDALRRLLKNDFAVILLDVFMPGMDGYETAAIIREREQTAKVPIIFLSAVNKEVEHLMRGYEMGAVDYVFKPVEPIVLRSKVSVFVDLYDMRRQIEEQSRAEQDLREANYREQLSRIEAERQLEDSEFRQAAVLQALPVVLYMEEPEEALRVPKYVAGNFQGLTGFTPEETASAPDFFEARVHPDDRAKVVKALQDRLTSGTMAIEYRWKCANDEYRYFFDQTVELPATEGKRRVAGTFMDVSERKRLEAQLVHVGKLDALGQLTGGVAHDFNNLLSAMMGGLYLLKRRVQFEEREQILIGQMEHAAEQGAELVRRMMAFARQQDLTPTSIDPSGLCESVAGLVSHTLGGSVVVDWRCPDVDLNIFVDRGQLELSLMNLILNARDAMADSGGTITVAIDRSPKDLAGQAAIRIQVIDTGTGIPADMIDKVTEPFFTTKQVGKGTGLGLSMVAGFINQSGGHLSIESAPGEGTTVSIVLPATGTSAIDPNDDGDRCDHGLGGERLLLIDDDDNVRTILAEQLREIGALVDDYSSGPDAIEAVRNSGSRHRYIICDFAMPGMDGLQTLRALREIESDATSILLTGHADDKRLTSDVEFLVLRKPANLHSIVECLRSSKTRKGKSHRVMMANEASGGYEPADDVQESAGQRR